MSVMDIYATCNAVVAEVLSHRTENVIKKNSSNAFFYSVSTLVLATSVLITLPATLSVTWLVINWLNQPRFPWQTLRVDNSSHYFHNAGAPARTVGWRDPGFIHTSFLKELWPNSEYVLSFDDGFLAKKCEFCFNLDYALGVKGLCINAKEWCSK